MPPHIPRVRMGGWSPGLQPDLSLAFMLLLSTEVLVRGVDYITGDRKDVTQSLSIVESAMPLQVWGALLIAAGASFTFGVLARRFGPLIFGAVLIMAIYGAISFGLFLRMVERGWPWDGFRTPLMFTIFSLMFAICAFSAYLKRSAHRVEAQMKEGDRSSSTKEA